MILCKARVEQEEFDIEMQRMALQTSLLMNATGNYKKQIKPSDIYTSILEEKKETDNKSELTKEELQADLLKAFAGSDVVVN